MHRFLKHVLNVRADRIGRHTRWGVRHIVGAALCATLEGRFRVSPELAVCVGREVAALPSDEAAEAVLQGGKCFVLIAGRNAAPILHTFQEVRELDAEIGLKLAALGIQIQALDLRELWNDIVAAARQDADAEAESEFA